MNGRVSKMIRRIVYGTDFSPRARKYSRNKKTGNIVADEKRRLYQLTKKVYSAGKLDTEMKGHE